MCLYSKLVPNPRYTPNKKNGGIIPAVHDDRVLSSAIGCGNCIECRKQKARDWQIRLLEEIKADKYAKMITLTFSNNSITKINKKIPNTWKDKKGNDFPLIGYKRDNEIAKYAVHHFRERWRKEYGSSIKHWLITELGHKGTENIHMHGFLWTEEPYFIIRSKWSYGHIWPRPEHEKNTYVNAQTINYTIKYVYKIDEDHKYYKPIILTSPGIGAKYLKSYDAHLNRYKENGETNETYRTPSGHKISMPKYYRNKIYTDEEREKLWINILDKNERWICGEKIDITKGSKEYFETLSWYRQKNKELGYGDDKKEWTKIEQEEARRIYLLKKRITPSAGSIQKGMD